jgi:hypothetical protein
MNHQRPTSTGLGSEPVCGRGGGGGRVSNCVGVGVGGRLMEDHA